MKKKKTTKEKEVNRSKIGILIIMMWQKKFCWVLEKKNPKNQGA